VLVVRQPIDMRTDPGVPAKVASLALPFALVGLAAGWLAVGLLENPLVYRSYRVNRPAAALVAAAVAASVGAYLSRSRGSRAAGSTPLSNMLLLAPPVIGAGGVVALIVALWGEGWTDHTMDAVAFGLASGVAFLPICRAVVASAERSARARMGSLVARADRRAVWSILATCVGVATLVSIIDWPAAREPRFDPPWISFGLAGAATLLVLVVRIADGRANTRIEALAAETDQMERCDASASVVRPAPMEIDLGLGDEAHARFDHGVAGYRDRDRPRALLMGNPARARQALSSALRRGTLCCATLALVLGAHLLATGEPFAYLYQQERCDRMTPYGCTEAARLTDSSETRRVLYRRACDGFDWEACDWLRANPPRRPQ